MCTTLAREAEALARGAARDDVDMNMASRIIFTNGLNDGWSVGGVLRNLSETLLAFNMPNGAHHSDLSHNWPSDADTQDVRDARAAIEAQLAEWVA